MENTVFSAKDDTDPDIAEGYYIANDQEGAPVWKKNIYSFPPIRYRICYFGQPGL